MEQARHAPAAALDGRCRLLPLAIRAETSWSSNARPEKKDAGGKDGVAAQLHARIPERKRGVILLAVKAFAALYLLSIFAFAVFAVRAAITPDRPPCERGGFQFLFHGHPRNWSFGFVRLRVADTALALVFDWFLFIGPFEFRKWLHKDEADRRLYDYNTFD